MSPNMIAAIAKLIVSNYLAFPTCQRCSKGYMYVTYGTFSIHCNYCLSLATTPLILQIRKSRHGDVKYFLLKVILLPGDRIAVQQITVI